MANWYDSFESVSPTAVAIPPVAGPPAGDWFANLPKPSEDEIRKAGEAALSRDWENSREGQLAREEMERTRVGGMDMIRNFSDSPEVFKGKTNAEADTALKAVGLEKAMPNASVRNVVTGVGQAGADYVALAQRPFDSEAADATLREKGQIDQAAAIADESSIAPRWANRALRGASGSVAQMLATRRLGMTGMAAGFGAAQANQAITTGKDAGLEGTDLARYAAAQGANEFLTTVLFNKMGLGGAEAAMVANGIAKQGIKQAGKDFLKGLAVEQVEEQVINYNSAVIDHLEKIGDDPRLRHKDGSWADKDGNFTPFMQSVLDVAAATTLVSGGASAPALAKGAYNSATGNVSEAEAKFADNPSRANYKAAFGTTPPPLPARQAKAEEVKKRQAPPSLPPRTPDGRWSNVVPPAVTPSGSMDATTEMPKPLPTPEQFADTQDMTPPTEQIANEPTAAPVVGQTNQAAPEPPAPTQEAGQVATPLEVKKGQQVTVNLRGKKFTGEAQSGRMPMGKVSVQYWNGNEFRSEDVPLRDVVAEQPMQFVVGDAVVLPEFRDPDNAGVIAGINDDGTYRVHVGSNRELPKIKPWRMNHSPATDAPDATSTPATPLPDVAALAAKFGVTEQPASPAKSATAVLKEARKARTRYERERPGYDKPDGIRNDDPEWVRLNQAVKNAQRQETKADNAPEQVAARKQAQQDFKAGKLNAGVVKLHPLAKLPPALSEAMQDEAETLLREDNPAEGAAKALRAIADGKDADANSDVENQRERIFRILTGELDQRTIPARERGEPQRPPNPIVSVFTAEADDRVTMLREAIAEAEAGPIESSSGDWGIAPSVYYMNPLTEAVRRKLYNDNRANGLPHELSDPETFEVTEELESLAAQTKTPLESVRTPDPVDDGQEPGPFDEPPAQPATALGLTGEQQPETVQRQPREAVAAPVAEAVQAVVTAAKEKKQRTKKGKKTAAELDALAAKVARAEPVDDDPTQSPEAIADMLSAEGHLSLAKVKAQFPGLSVVKRGQGYDVTLADGRKVRVEAVKNIAVTKKAWMQAEEAYGKQFTPAQRQRMRARGMFVLKPSAVRAVDAIGLVQLAAEMAQNDTLPHEVVHLADQLGYFKPAEWKALVKQFSDAKRSRRTQGEDIARGFGEQRAAGDATWWDGVKNWFKDLMARFFPSVTDAELVKWRMTRPGFWQRMPSVAGESVSLHLDQDGSAGYESLIDAIVRDNKTSFRDFALEVAKASSDATFYEVANDLAQIWDDARQVYKRRGVSAKQQLEAMRQVGLDKVRKALAGKPLSKTATRKVIREQTTVSPGEAVKMTPKDLMKLALSREARGAARGYRAAKADVKWNQEQVMEFVNKQIPKKLQGRVLNVVKNANSPAMMRKAIQAINKLGQRLEAQAARSELRKTIRDAKKKIGRSEYKAKLKAILDGLKMTSPKPETLARLQSLLEAARTEMASNPDQFTQIPADMIKKAEEVLANQSAKPLDQLTGAEIRTLQDAIESLVTLDNFKNKLLFGGKVRSADKAVTEAADGLVARHGEKTSSDPTYRKFENAIRYGLVELGVSPETLIRYLGGVSRRIFSDNFRAAERMFAKLSNRTQDDFRNAIYNAGISLNELPDWSDVMSKGGLRKVLRMIRGKSKTVALRHKVWLPTATNESGRRRLSLDLTKAEIAELVLHIGDTDTEKKMLGPGKGIRLRSWAAGEDAVKLNAEDMTAVLQQADKIDPRIKRLAGELSKIVNEQGKSTGEVWQRMYGQDFELLEKYWPRHADEQDFSDEPNPGMKKFADSMLEHQSHLKERSGGNQAIIVGDAFGTFVGHTARSNAFISKAEAVHDALRLLGDEKYKRTLSRTVKDGEGIQERLKNYIDEWQGVSLKGKSHIGRVAESAARTLISNFSKAALGFKPHIWAMQLSGITSFMAEIKPQYVLGALSGAVNASDVNAEIMANSDVLRRRLEGTDFNSLTDPDVMSSPAQQMAGIDTRSISDIIALEPIRKVDNFNLRVGWLAAKAEGEAQGLTGDALMDYTANRTEQLIEDTQASWDVRTTSTAQALGRSSVGWKMFSMFASERLKKYNMAMQAAHEYRFDSNQDAAAKAKLAERIAYGQIANAIGTTGARWAYRGTLAAITAAILGYRDDEDKSLGKNVLDFLYDSVDSMLGSWAIAGDAVSSMARLAKGWFEGDKRAQFYRPRETPLGQFGTMLVQTVDESRKAVLDAKNDTRVDRGPNKGKPKAGYSASKAAEKGVLTVGTFLGLPAQGVDMMIRDLLPHNRMYDYTSPEVFEVARQAKAFNEAEKEFKAMVKAGKPQAELDAFTQAERAPLYQASQTMEYINARYKAIGDKRENYPETPEERKVVDAQIEQWQNEIEEAAKAALKP